MSETAKKERIWLILAVILLAGIYGAWGMVESWLANRALANFDWDHYSNSADEQLELRIICHKIISYKYGNHHDAFVTLIQIGNPDSVPLLINALKWHEPTDGSDIVSCTTDHCVEALRNLTGMDFGYSYKDWHKWLQTQR
ncbi:MAG: hypothetical protein CVV42_05770 [Candidatus Riflebacteria bacterium HGW-Riflebacteria-2]|jgi:hypothetical protein|nr:MAG: hypothetical protein CVV42_05770 [Candidatus Riflebacteria bacterium HGW-Riflebacteria-2]